MFSSCHRFTPKGSLQQLYCHLACQQAVLEQASRLALRLSRLFYRCGNNVPLIYASVFCALSPQGLASPALHEESQMGCIDWDSESRRRRWRTVEKTDGACHFFPFSSSFLPKPILRFRFPRLPQPTSYFFLNISYFPKRDLTFLKYICFQFKAAG